VNKKILITGGIGYLGSRAVDYFAKKYWDSSIYFTHYTDKHNAIFEKYANVYYRKLDLNQETDFDLVCEGIDLVIHLAFPNEIVCVSETARSIETGVVGTYLLLESALKHGVKHLVFLSTIHVYGENLNKEITEKTIATPIHPYAILKRSAEDHVRFFNEKKGLKTTIIRLSNGFGAPFHQAINRHKLFFNDVCRQALTTKQIVLKSSGKRKLDFVSFAHIFKVLDSILFQGKECNDIINLGSGLSLSTLEMAGKIAQIIEKEEGREIPITVNTSSEELVNENLEYRSEFKQTETDFDQFLEQEVNQFINSLL
jgi:UDP-glucose 4-epimerase